VPAATVIAALVNPAGPNSETQSTRLQAASRILGLRLHILHARTEAELDQAFASVAQTGASALLICADSLFVSRSAELAALAARHAVPAIW
jgi:putative ABC transport system substrate-binding protein